MNDSSLSDEFVTFELLIRALDRCIRSSWHGWHVMTNILHLNGLTPNPNYNLFALRDYSDFALNFPPIKNFNYEFIRSVTPNHSFRKVLLTARLTLFLNSNKTKLAPYSCLARLAERIMDNFGLRWLFFANLNLMLYTKIILF